MIRTVTIITIAAFFLSAVSLAVAFSLAGPDLISEASWGWGPFTHHHSFGWSRTHSFDGPQTTREVPWTGGESLLVMVPAAITFTQADGPPKLIVHGPKDAVDDLNLTASPIELKHHSGLNDPAYDGGAITIELTAPKVTTFQIYGSSKLDIRNYHQDRLRIGAFGSGDVTAEGSTGRLDLTVNGSNDADLSRLAADDAAVTVSGSGQVKVAPKHWARVELSGSGDVTLTTKPKQLESHVSGSGHLEQSDGSDVSTGSGEKT
ncbi:GIN domain-containing protein [Phenylobacterium sp.]|uniref:GIN domain-containing protein n=1 Tax=Phenylobacterium sp. TaxID=1871053 RepID=UPI002DEED613|nr:DUF2807 domain-containing protein [Phenylobacterium sp.]